MPTGGNGLTIFRRFPTTFRRFTKILILLDLSEGYANVTEHFSKISEDSPKLSRKTQRCFDHTLTNSCTVKETNLISAKSSMILTSEDIESWM